MGYLVKTDEKGNKILRDYSVLRTINIYNFNSSGRYNDLLNRFVDAELSLKYEYTYQEIKIKYKYVFDNVYLTLNKWELSLVRGFFDKYLEWSKKASKKGVTLNKRIGYIYLEGYVESNGHTEDIRYSLTFKLFSQSKKHHQLLIEYSGGKGEYSTYQMPTVYMEKDDVKGFLEKTKKSNIRGYDKMIEKQIKISKEFN